MIHDLRSLLYIPSSGRLISTCVHVPRDNSNGQSGPWPYVIMCHGFLGNKTGRYRYQVELSEQLAANGIASIRFDYSGCGDSHGHSSEISFLDIIDDTVAIIEWARTQKELYDSERSIVWGRSFGAMVAVHALAQLTVLPKAQIIQAPMYDAEYWLRNQNVALTQDLTAYRFLPFKGERVSTRLVQQLQKSNTFQALQTSLSIPFLVIRHVNDEVIPQDHVDKYLVARNSAVYTKLVDLDDSDHECSNYEIRQKSLSLSLDWISKII